MITLSQASVGTSAVKVVSLPAGHESVTLTVAAPSTTTVYFGTSSTVSTTNGAPLSGGQSVTVHGHTGSAAQDLWAVASGASTPVGVFVCTP